MSEIRAMIADDEPAARARLRQLIAGEPDVTIVAEAASGPETVAHVRRWQPELLLLDIQMPGMDGFGVLQALEPHELPPVLVFVTAYDTYALRAFEAHALDYLLKPFDDARFAATLERVRARLRERDAGELRSRLQTLLAAGGWAEHPVGSATSHAGTRGIQRIPVRQRDRIVLVDVGRVDWIEAAGDYVRLHTTGQAPALARYTLAALERELDDRFIRVHRSAIVRLDAVKQLFPRTHGDYDLVLRDGTELRLSRLYRERLGRALAVDL